MHLGTNIKHLRTLAKLSQEKLGEKLGISHAQIGAYEKGESDPPLSKLIKLCDLFSLSLDDLVYSDLRISVKGYLLPRKEAASNEIGIREYFAGLALQGLLANPGSDINEPEKAARIAVNYADSIVNRLRD